jgi:hypothetical protein
MPAPCSITRIDYLAGVTNTGCEPIAETIYFHAIAAAAQLQPPRAHLILLL